MSDTTKPKPCGLALTLLSRGDVCPACGHPVETHPAWLAEVERGAIPSERPSGKLPPFPPAPPLKRKPYEPPAVTSSGRVVVVEGRDAVAVVEGRDAVAVVEGRRFELGGLADPFAVAGPPRSEDGPRRPPTAPPSLRTVENARPGDGRSRARAGASGFAPSNVGPAAPKAARIARLAARYLEELAAILAE